MRAFNKNRISDLGFDSDDGLGRVSLSGGEVEQLLASLRYTDPQSHRAVCAAVRQVGAAAVPALARALRSPVLAIRQSAARLLGQISPADVAIEDLTRAMDDSDWLVRMWSADALARIGPTARDAVPALRRAAEDTDHHVRISAALAIQGILRR